MSLTGPIPLGKNRRILAESPTVGGSITKTFGLDAEAVQISVWTNSVGGTLDIKVYSFAENPAHRSTIISFPTLTAASTELLLRKSAATMSQIIVEVTYSDDADYEVWARGVSAAAASTLISGAAELKASQLDVSAAGTVLIPAALTDRNGIGIKNNNSTAEILYVGESALASDPGNGWSIEPGGNLTINIAAGVELYGTPSSGTIDVRLLEIGGG